MKSQFRAILSASAAIALVSTAPALAQTVPQWAHAKSDLKPDPAIRFGVLPNGMRYALRKQTTPPGQASLRLRFDAGAMMETDAQQGLAHFLEHMAFNGSKGVKEGEMVKILERLGLAFGPDTNAQTGFSETIYMLELPKTNDETVDTSLMLMREAAGNLIIDAAAVDRERGVVLSEERARDTPGYRVTKARLEYLLKGQRLPTRLPIGKTEVLKNAPASQLTAFYKAYYRPERATLVAAGDFDLDAMEAKIKAKFSDWKAEGPPPPKLDEGKVAPRQTEAKLMVEPGIQPAMQVVWISPPDLSPDTQARRRKNLVERLAFQVLNRRYSNIARAGGAPFIGASSFQFQQEDSAELTLLSVTSDPARWREALAAAEQEQRRAVQFGVRQDELDREVVEMRAALKAAAAGAATRRPTELVNEIVGSLADDDVVTSPADDLALFETFVKGLKADEASAALAAAFKGQGPLLFMASPTPVEGGDKALLAAYQGSTQVAVKAPEAQAQIAWPYADFGPAGAIAERREVADIGTTFIRFKNGVRLTVKPTKFRDDEVIIRVNVGEGLLELPKDKQSPSWAGGIFTEGGLKKIPVEDMERALASTVYSARFGIADEAFVISGSTRTGDLEPQMQVLAAYLADPAWRPAAFQRLKTAGKTIHDQYESTDTGVLNRDLAGILHSGDRRWTFPSRDEIANAKAEEISGAIAPHLADGAVEVVVVGDVTVDQVVASVAKTFAALPARPDAKPVPASQRQVAFPSGKPQVRLTHKGRADQAIGYIGWKTNDYFANPQRARETAVMSEVLQLRLTDELREAQGATYSPSVGVNHSFAWTGWGYVAASVEVPPEKLDPFFADVTKIAADLKAKEVTADELARAKTPRIERLQKARVTNQFWLAELSGAQTDPRRLENIRDNITGTEKVTAADVQRAAQAYLTDDRAFRLTVSPETKAVSAP